MGEHYIPLRPADLVQRLGDEPSVTIFEREQFRQLCQLVGVSIHHEFHTRLEALRAAYGPFNPDEDALGRPVLSDEQRAGKCERLFAEFDALLARANYRQLTREEIEQAVRTPSEGGLRLQLDLNLFERLEIYVRGQYQAEQANRSWKIFGRSTQRNVPTYRRLAIIFRLRRGTLLTDPLDTRVVVLKLFK